MSAVFVTGTGTDIGKTHIAAAMLRHWRSNRVMASALKPVASGYQPALSVGSDAGVLLRAMGQLANDAAVARICPWRFTDPLSPDMAAARAGKHIPFDELVDFCRAEIRRATGMLLIEGVGGAMVPLDDRHTVRDWIAELRIPAIVVTGAYLGTISHTLTTIEALRARNIDIAAIVINPITPGSVPIAATQASIARHLPEPYPLVVFDKPDWVDWLSEIKPG